MKNINENIKERMSYFFLEHFGFKETSDNRIKSFIRLQIESMLEKNPYFITRFLDKNGIYVSIIYDDGFRYSVNGSLSDKFLTREEAELKAIEESVSMLESKTQ